MKILSSFTGAKIKVLFIYIFSDSIACRATFSRNKSVSIIQSLKYSQIQEIHHVIDMVRVLEQMYICISTIFVYLFLQLLPLTRLYRHSFCTTV